MIAVSRIKYFSRDAIRLRCLKQQAHYIFHIGKITRLLTIAVDRGATAFQQASQKNRQYTRIHAGGILPRPEDVEEPKRYRLQTVTLRKNVGVIFANQFLQRIRRFRTRRHAFSFRQHLGIAVSRRGGSVDHAPRFTFHRGAKYVEGAVNVYFVARYRIKNRFWYRWQCAQVEDSVGTGNYGSNPVVISKIEFVNVDLVGYFLQIVELACGQIVDHFDTAPIRQ